MSELFNAVWNLWEANFSWDEIATELDTSLTELCKDPEVFELYCK